MKKTLILCTLLIISNIAVAQHLRNFDKKGKKIRLKKEQVRLEVVPKQHHDNIVGLTPASPASIINGVIPLIVDITKSALAARKASYTATYSASCSGEYSGSLDGQNIRLTRSIIQKNESTAQIAIKTLFSIHEHTGMFNIQIDSLDFNYSKARIRRRKNLGKGIDISYDIKITGYWTSYSDPKDNTSPITLNSATLGESTIILFGLVPGSNQMDDLLKNNSDWFQIIPKSISGTPNWYTINITVKEANPDGLSSTDASSFFQNNTSDISSFLQTILQSK